MAKQSTQGTAVPVAIVKDLFGDYPEDVISPIKSVADALSWLEEIFTTIKNEALEGRNGYRIKQLAEAGAYLAADMGNYACSKHESYLERLQSAGFAPLNEVASHD